MEKYTLQKRHITIFVFIILLIPFLSIAGIKNAIDSRIYEAWQIASCVFLALLILLKRSKIKLNWILALFLIYQTIILLSSFLNNGFSPGIMVVVVTSMLVFVLFQSDYYQELLSAVCVIIIISLIINFPVMLLNINDVDANYFIGGKNSLGIFLIPGAFLLLINSIEKNKKISKLTIIMLILSLITVFVGSSGTGIVVTFLALLFLLLSIKFKPKKFIYLSCIIFVYLMFVVFFDKVMITKYWLEFTDYLGKDATLTSRTAIWNSAKDIIKNNWFFGAGRGVEISYFNSLGERQIMYETHNYVLEILLEGGILALIIYSIMLYKIVANLKMKNIKHRILFVALCVFLINGLTESIVNNFMVMIILSITCRYTANEKRTVKKWIQD